MLMHLESKWFDMVPISRFDGAGRKVPRGLFLLDGGLWGRNWWEWETNCSAWCCSSTKCASCQTEAHANDTEHQAKRDNEPRQHHRWRRGEAEELQEGNVEEGSFQGPGCLPKATFSTSWTGDSVSSSKDMNWHDFISTYLVLLITDDIY